MENRKPNTPTFATGTVLLVGALWTFATFQSAVADEDGSITKDLHILQIDMVIPKPAASTEGAAPALRVNASVDRGEGSTYRIGEDVRLAVEVSEDAHLWVFNTGSSGNVHRIFPNRFEQDNFVRKGETLTIPGSDARYDFRASNPPGRELLTVIATTSDEPLGQALVDEAVGSGAFYAMVGNAASVAKDLSISLRQDHPVWHRDVVVVNVVE